MQPLPPLGYSNFRGTQNNPQNVIFKFIDGTEVRCESYQKEKAFGFCLRRNNDAPWEEVSFEQIAEIILL